MSRQYILYFKQDDDFVMIHKNSDVIQKDKFKPRDINKYFMRKGYEPTEEGLRLFKKDFQQWCTELANNNVLNIIYDKYYTDYTATEMTFKRLAKGKYEHFEKIDAIENTYMNNCHNGALAFCDPQTCYSYGYDFKGYYGENLVNIKIPSKRGQEVTLDKLPKKKKDLKHGYYRCDIICSDKYFDRVFNYSKNKTYTNTTINFLRRLKKKYNFNIKIKIINDGEPNAYVYDDDCIVDGKDIFGRWYEITNKIKTMYPKNKLVKHLQSSLWGHLCRYNKKDYSTKYIDANNMWDKISIGTSGKYQIIEHTMNGDDNDYYTLLDIENIYKYGLARLKPFLTAHGRNRTALVVLEDIENVVRVYNDNVTFNKEQTFNIHNLLNEDKTTGLIKWKNCLRYDKVDDN